MSSKYSVNFNFGTLSTPKENEKYEDELYEMYTPLNSNHNLIEVEFLKMGREQTDQFFKEQLPNLKHKTFRGRKAFDEEWIDVKMAYSKILNGQVNKNTFTTAQSRMLNFQALLNMIRGHLFEYYASHMTGRQWDLPYLERV